MSYSYPTKRVKICKFFARRRCVNDENCRFLHVLPSLATKGMDSASNILIEFKPSSSLGQTPSLSPESSIVAATSSSSVPLSSDTKTSLATCSPLVPPIAAAAAAISVAIAADAPASVKTSFASDASVTPTTPTPGVDDDDNENDYKINEVELKIATGVKSGSSIGVHYNPKKRAKAIEEYGERENCNEGRWIPKCSKCRQWDKYMYADDDVVLCCNKECQEAFGYVDITACHEEKPCYSNAHSDSDFYC